MYDGISPLTDREKEVLRLLLLGHDAKSAASVLQLSVHTVNERLRDSRRKFGVTSSREAARILGELEHKTHKKFGDENFGVAQTPNSEDLVANGSKRTTPLQAWQIAGGAILIMVVLGAAFMALGDGAPTQPVASGDASINLQAQAEITASAPAVPTASPPSVPGALPAAMDLMPLADADGDSRVTLAEYEVFSQQGWDVVSQGKDHVVFAELDPMSQLAFFGIRPNANGQITRDMYEAAITVRFALFDQDRNGTLSAGEINGTAFQQ